MIFCTVSASLLTISNEPPFTAPLLPDQNFQYLSSDPESFGQGLWKIIKAGVEQFAPSLQEAAGACLSIILIGIVLSLVDSFPGKLHKQSINLSGSLMTGLLLLKTARSLILLGSETIYKLYDYGKLLIPIMTSALAAQGGISSSGALYAGSAAFCSLLSSFISKGMIPMIFLFLAISVANSSLNQELLAKLQEFMKWTMTWSLKTLLYIFTGYLTVTGVISGTADASAIKATKLAISGAVPVVGNILSDASETILISAGVVKNAAGIYGMLALLAIWIEPFIKIGCHYLFIKFTAGLCHMFAPKELSGLMEQFAYAMGLTAAMTGTACLLLLVSVICFMKGVS